MDENAEVVIRTYAAEALDIPRDVTIEELARRCVPSAEIEAIEIDASNPNDYRRLAA